MFLCVWRKVACRLLYAESASGSGSDSEQERPRSVSNVSGSDSDGERDDDDEEDGQERGKNNMNKVEDFVISKKKWNDQSFLISFYFHFAFF